MNHWEATALWTLSLTMYECAGLLPRPKKLNMNNLLLEFLEAITKLTCINLQAIKVQLQSGPPIAFKFLL